MDQYASSIVEKYHVEADVGSAPHRAADAVLPLLKQWGRKHVLGLTLSGAYAKNTAVSLSSQADILCVLTPVPHMDMKKIFWSLFEFLTERDLHPRTREVSVQLPVQGIWVDVIPALRERTSGNTLFNKRSGRTIETDVAQHVHLIANSGRQQEICALKIWRERNELVFPSLLLELGVLQALASERHGQLADNVLAVMRYLANRFEQAVVCDPANTENVISEDLTVAEKRAIAKAARTVLYDENWKKILW